MEKDFKKFKIPIGWNGQWSH